MDQGLPSFIRREDDRVVQEKRIGLYEGKVEYVDDPCNNGRIKVRVAGVFGNGESIPSLQLPWALPCFMPGSFTVPDVGDTVMVHFRKGDPRFPVYFGVIYGILADEDLHEARIKGRLPGLGDPSSINREGRCASVGDFEAPAANNDLTYEQPPGNDAPLESFVRRNSAHPYVRVIASSPKGHSIYMSDEPTQEVFKLVDRGGQTIELSAPVKADENIANMARRGTGEAVYGTQLKMNQLEGEKAHFQIVDMKEQKLRFDSNEGACTATLQGPRSNNDLSGFIQIREFKQEIEARSDAGGKESSGQGKGGYWLLDTGYHVEDDTRLAYIDIHNGVIELAAGASSIVISGESIVLSSPRIDLN